MSNLEEDSNVLDRKHIEDKTSASAASKVIDLLLVFAMVENLKLAIDSRDGIRSIKNT